MLTGNRFKLERATLPVDMIDSRLTIITVPGGEIVKVLSGPKNGEGLINVSWDNKKLQMFAVDVDVRGTEMLDQSAKA